MIKPESQDPAASEVKWASPFVGVVLLWAGIEIACIWVGISPILKGEFADPDSYGRLLRVIHLIDTGNWYDGNLPRSNWPYGETMNWTRPIDVLLLAGTAVLRPFMSFHDALFLFGVVMGPLITLASAVTAGWMAVPILGRKSRYEVMLLLLLQLAAVAYMIAGRADHHGMLFLSYIFVIGFCLRAMAPAENLGAAIAAGAVAGFGLWISTEFLTVLISVLTTFGLLWLWQGGRWTRTNRGFVQGLAIAVVVALPIERSPFGGLLVDEYDRLSIVHLVLALLLLAFWMLVPLLAEKLRPGAFSRAGAATIGLFVAGSVMYAIYPRFFGGPLVAVDPVLQKIWFWGVNEWQPVLPTSLAGVGQFLFWLGTPALCFLWALRTLWLLRREDAAPGWLFLAISLLLYLYMTMRGLRFAGFAEIASLIPLHGILTWAYRRLSERPAWWMTMVRVTAVSMIIYGLPLAGSLISRAVAAGGTGPVHESCSIADIAPTLNALGQSGGRPNLIAAGIDSGPEIMYRTADAVLATPMHRNIAGILAAYRMMTAGDDADAKAIIVSREVDLVLLCPGSTERSFFNSDNQENTFYNRLVEGRLPTWLHQLPLPEGLAKHFRLFAVARNAT